MEHQLESNNNGKVFFLWWLILLKIPALLVMLIAFSPLDQPPAKPDLIAALDVPPPQVVPAILPVLVPSPTPPNSGPALDVTTIINSPLLRLRGMEITQGLQVFNEPELARCHPYPDHPDNIFCNNSMPLVAGRHTLVRVYAACNGPCPQVELTVTLRLLRAGQEQAALRRALSPAQLQRISGLPLPELRAKLENSVNFEFFPPPTWLAGPITFELEGTLPGEPPATLALTKNFAMRPPLRVAYLPIQYQGQTGSEPAGLDYWLLRLYPVPAVEYYRLPVPDLVWEGELDKEKLLEKLLYTYWLYAREHPPELWPDQLFGWLPPEAFNGGASDPFWCPACAGLHSSRVAFGGLRPEQDIGGPRIMAHEIAHNLGAKHAWSPTQTEDGACFRDQATDIQSDPAWPYPNSPQTQEFGIDLYSTPPIIYPPSVYDLMSYCGQPWISPYTYRKIFESPLLQPEQSLLPLDFQPQVAPPGPNGVVMVTGIVYPDGTLFAPEVVQLGQE
jgi:hypothetical protein